MAIPGNVPTLQEQVNGAFTVTPDLPAGLSPDPTMGVISGTPAVHSHRSDFDVTVSTVRSPVSRRLSIAVHDVSSTHMNTPRSGHVASLLPDGRVLFTGGSGNDHASLPEVYDPASKTFMDTGTEIIPRKELTATVLPSGKVLLAGGNFSSTGSKLSANPSRSTATGSRTCTCRSAGPGRCRSAG